AILESRKVAGGTTAHSTGNLYCIIDQTLSSLEKKYDDDAIEKVAASRREALRQIKMWIEELNLDCDYRELAFRWGGQHYRPADLLPYIGSTFMHENNLIATGFSTDGLVYGTLSAMILADKIMDKENRW